MKRCFLTNFTAFLFTISFCFASSGVLAANEPEIIIMTEMNPVKQSRHPMYKNGLDIIKHSKLDYKIRSMPWNRAYHSAKTTANAVIFPIYKIPNRKNDFHWVCPIASSRNMYLFRLASRQDLHINRFAQTTGKVIGVVKESMLHQYILKHQQKSNFSLDSTVYDATNIEKLLNGRLDYIAQSQEQFIEYFKRNNLSHHLVKKELLIYDHTLYPMCMAISKGTAQETVDKISASHHALFGHNDFSPQPIINGFENCH
ncbi:substrate-binding periplasmic protein [Psychrobium sp. nBUS_13]|uniref:substrate-binding periplasmic protein n=1 Tax=Psychrobium sp. nBUS_13 TaxID=3395319 RepID=UPI003EB81A6C